MSKNIQMEDVPGEVKHYFSTIIIHHVDKLSVDDYKDLINVDLKQVNTDFLNGVTLNNLICSIMKNSNNTFEFQEAHQDYYPKAIGQDIKEYKTLLPMTTEGSWNTVRYS
jgi:hypothetical protein